MNQQNVKRLRKILDKALEDFIEQNEVLADALGPAFAFKRWHDQELAAFICSILAYGKVSQINRNIRKILDPMGASPHEWLMNAKLKDLKKISKNWYHRFNNEKDILTMLQVLQKIYSEYGSIEKFIGADESFGAYEVIEKFAAGIDKILLDLPAPDKSFWFFIPRPSDGSACKRMNLFLRWMVGRSATDFNLWSTIHTRNLVIPLDVHIFRQAHSLKLTRRKQANWETAVEITNSLKHLDPLDPTKYDFALCHLGMRGNVLSQL